jgi:hypothetical protein
MMMGPEPHTDVAARFLRDGAGGFDCGTASRTAERNTTRATLDAISASVVRRAGWPNFRYQ